MATGANLGTVHGGLKPSDGIVAGVNEWPRRRVEVIHQVIAQRAEMAAVTDLYRFAASDLLRFLRARRRPAGLAMCNPLYSNKADGSREGE